MEAIEITPNLKVLRSDERRAIERNSRSAVGGLRHLKAALETDLDRNGFALVEDLPDSRDETLIALISLLGTPIHDHNAGPMIMDIKPSPHDTTENPTSYYTWNDFDFHTDLTFAETPPELLAVVCVQPHAHGEGFSLFADAECCLRYLSRSALHELQKPQFEFGAPLHYRGGPISRRPVLTLNAKGKFDLRLRFDKLTTPNEQAKSALRELYEALNRARVQISLKQNSAYILNNRRVVHGRTAFTPVFDATDRHLKRIYAMRHIS